MRSCIFCRIVDGEEPCHRVWEDEEHLAFLSIFPNTEAVTVVVTRVHQPSYVFDLADEVMVGLFRAARHVGKCLDAKLADVGRCGLVAEGFGVDHAHLKLFPMHGTKFPDWRPIRSNLDKYFELYEGYLSSHDYRRADDVQLAALARRLRGGG